MENKKKVLEFTLVSLVLGIIVGTIMTAANVYLGLYAGMTVSASIPAAVIAMAVFKALGKSSVLEANIVQTMASAGESIAAGVIFTLPALVLVGAWQDFQFWPTFLIASCGGLLGVAFMVPLRKALIIEDKDLTYPEGVACAAVLEAGAKNEGKGAANILKGLGLGALFKFFSSGIGLFKGSVEMATKSGKSTWFFGTDISPALLAVGYIVKLEVAILVFIGGAIGWFIGIPLLGAAAGTNEMSALDSAWTLWSKQIRYLGVGAMIAGGLWSIISVRKGIVSGLQGLRSSYDASSLDTSDRTNQNLGLIHLLVLLLVAITVMFFLYHNIIGTFGLSLFTTFLMTVVSFIFVAVSSYIVGLVGSSNNPVSGMTISALLGTAAFFLVLGFKGDSAILATLGVAAVVCCAACTAGDCSQDLKTGVLVKATPKYQQLAQIIGVIVPTLVVAPVLSILHSSYGIGEGLKAPQATLFASITEGLFKEGSLPLNMVGLGVVAGILIIAIDKLFLAPKKTRFRLHVMPLAVGIYLPVTLAVPMLLGGVIRELVEKVRGEVNEGNDNGILLSSGLIAGEALMGVVMAIVIYYQVNLKLDILSSAMSEILSIAALLALAFYLKKLAERKA